MQTYSKDLRERIVAARKRGLSAQEISRIFGVSKRSVERFWKLYLETGGVQPRQRGGYRRSCLEKHDQTLRGWIEREADLTLSQLRDRLALDLGIKLGITALWHRLEHLGLSYKKNAARRRARPPGHSGRPAAMAKRTRKLGRRKPGFSR